MGVVALLLSSLAASAFGSRLVHASRMRIQTQNQTGYVTAAWTKQQQLLAGLAGNPSQTWEDLFRDIFGSLFWHTRKDFLRNVKHETVQGRDHWILMLRKDISATRFKEIVSHNRVDLVGREGTVPFVVFKGTMNELKSVLDDYWDDVESVEPDMPVHLIDGKSDNNDTDVFGIDTHKAATKSMDNSAYDELCLGNMNLIGTQNRNHTGLGVHVYVVDTGIRTSHRDLPNADAVFEIKCENYKCVNVDCTSMPHDEHCNSDPDGHGTHVAGTVGGTHFGVATEASLHSVKVLNDQGLGAVSWVISGLEWIMSRGQKPGIVSMSIGMGRYDGGARALELATEEVINAGFTVVVASGNSNKDACEFSPAAVPTAVTVGSVTTPSDRVFQRQEKESAFSNYGPCVDILAPGENIWSTGHVSDDGAASMTGTSMATPHVTGAAALILEEEPDLSPTELWERLKEEYTVEGMSAVRHGTPNLRLHFGPSGPLCESGVRAGCGLTIHLVFLGVLIGLAPHSFA